MEFKIEKVTKITLELTPEEFRFIDLVHNYYLIDHPPNEEDRNFSNELLNISTYINGAHNP
jgi:hypothetical protein